MKTLTNKTIFKCDYCNKISLNKGAMAMHEKHCKRNPNNKTMCDDCYWMCYIYEKQHFFVETMLFDEEFDIPIRECVFCGKMYAKLKGLLAAEVEAEGWQKQPSISRGCKYYLNDEVAIKIKEWAETLKDNGKIFCKFDVNLSPEIVSRYYADMGDNENAQRFKIDK